MPLPLILVKLGGILWVLKTIVFWLMVWFRKPIERMTGLPISYFTKKNLFMIFTKLRYKWEYWVFYQFRLIDDEVLLSKYREDLGVEILKLKTKRSLIREHARLELHHETNDRMLEIEAELPKLEIIPIKVLLKKYLIPESGLAREIDVAIKTPRPEYAEDRLD